MLFVLPNALYCRMLNHVIVNIRNVATISLALSNIAVLDNDIACCTLYIFVYLSYNAPAGAKQSGEQLQHFERKRN